MDQFDREKARRVWQRVQGERMPSAPASMLSPNPEGLLLEELTDIRLLQQLLKQQKEPAAGLLKALISQGQNRIAILRCICHLAALTPPTALPKAEAPSLGVGLRRLMGHLLRRLQEYRRLTDHEEFAPLYEGLATDIHGSILTLARLIGR